MNVEDVIVANFDLIIRDQWMEKFRSLQHDDRLLRHATECLRPYLEPDVRRTIGTLKSCFQSLCECVMETEFKSWCLEYTEVELDSGKVICFSDLIKGECNGCDSETAGC